MNTRTGGSNDSGDDWLRYLAKSRDYTHLSRFLANRRRKLVLTPDFASYRLRR
jgi:hypothetical protein